MSADVCAQSRSGAYIYDASRVAVDIAVQSTLFRSGAEERQAFLREREDALEVEREELRPRGVLRMQPQ